MKFVRLSIFVVFLAVSCGNDPETGKSLGRWTDFSLESMTECHRQGLDYIEVTMNDIIRSATEGVEKRIEEVNADIEKSGLKVWSVHLPYSRTIDISVLDDSLRRANVCHIGQMMRLAAVFQPRNFVLHPSAEPIYDEERTQRMKNSHESIGKLAEVADSLGIVLCVENLPRTCLGQTGEEMTRLIEGYPSVGLCFDTNHLMYQSHEDYLKAVDYGKIRTVHLSDYDFTYERHWIPGQGLIDWKKLWNGIRDNGYQGIMMFECYCEPDEMKEAVGIILGRIENRNLELVNPSPDSLAFVNALWEKTGFEYGAEVRSARIKMFNSTQSVNVVKYPADRYRTEILHRPAEQAGVTSGLARAAGAQFGINGCYFNVKELTPTVYFRVGDEVYGRTQPAEVYRVDGVIGIKDEDATEIIIAKCDTSRYEEISKGWHAVMASGPLLMSDARIVVPEIMGDKADGANVTALKAEAGTEVKIKTHYSSAQFYDKRHPRAVIGTDDDGFVYFVVIDGRFKGQADGASIYETAYICHLLGMDDALNLDGGGSSSLWNEATGVVSHPYDNRIFDHEGERIVPNIIISSLK